MNINLNDTFENDFVFDDFTNKDNLNQTSTDNAFNPSRDFLLNQNLMLFDKFNKMIELQEKLNNFLFKSQNTTTPPTTNSNTDFQNFQNNNSPITQYHKPMLPVPNYQNNNSPIVQTFLDRSLKPAPILIPENSPNSTTTLQPQLLNFVNNSFFKKNFVENYIFKKNTSQIEITLENGLLERIKNSNEKNKKEIDIISTEIIQIFLKNNLFKISTNDWEILLTKILIVIRI